MKKAKVMLSALAVLAVIGSALAFKAGTFSDGKLFTSNGSVCVKDNRNFTLVNPSEGPIVGTVTTDVTTTICSYNISAELEAGN